MASLIEQRGRYYLDFNDRARAPMKRRVPLGVRNARDAARIRAKLERDYSLGTYDPWTMDPKTYDQIVVKPEKLNEAVAAYLDAKSHKSARTVSDYGKDLNRFVAFTGAGVLVSSLTAKHVEAWLASTSAGDVTRANYTRRLRTFSRWAVREGIAKSVFTEGVRLRRVPKKYPRFLSPGEVECIVATIRARARTAHWLADLVLFAVHTGLRRAELINLEWSAVDLDARVLTVANTETFTTKSGAERKVPLSATAVDVLARRGECGESETYVFTSSAGQLTADYLSRTFKKYARRAGIGDVHLHHTRHTAISWLAQRGVPVEAIRRFAGHSSITVTERYMHVSEDIYATQIQRALAA